MIRCSEGYRQSPCIAAPSSCATLLRIDRFADIGDGGELFQFHFTRLMVEIDFGGAMATPREPATCSPVISSAISHVRRFAAGTLPKRRSKATLKVNHDRADQRAVGDLDHRVDSHRLRADLDELFFDPARLSPAVPIEVVERLGPVELSYGVTSCPSGHVELLHRRVAFLGGDLRGVVRTP